jgi:simple sugar transport system permease protein
MAGSSETVSRGHSLGLITSLFQRREIGAVLAVFVLVAVGLLIGGDTFVSADNVLGILRNTAVVAIIGYGMTLLMVSGEFDLSVGSLMAVSMALVLAISDAGFSLPFAVLAVLLFAALYGIFQGLIITKLDLPSLIITIGTLTLLRGVLLVITEGRTQSIPSGELGLLAYLGGSTELGALTIPNQIFWTVGLLGIMYYVLNHTAFGYRSMFTGGNTESAKRTGIRVDQVKVMNFMLVAVLAAFAGMTQLGFTQSVSPLTGQQQELIVIASVVIGGTNLFGGEGSIPGTFLGALVFALTQNVLVLAGLGSRLFAIFTGLFIIAAVLIEVLGEKTRLETFLSQYVRPFRSLVAGPREFFRYVKTDVQGIDFSLAFLTINTLMLTVVSLLLLFLGNAVLPWEFSVWIVSPDVAALGTMSVLTFGVVATIALLTSIFVHAGARALGSDEKFDRTLQGVTFSLAPSLLLFVPILLAGWGFVSPLVLGSVLLVVVPFAYLLYASMEELHEFDGRNTLASVAAGAIGWVLVASYVLIELTG